MQLDLFLDYISMFALFDLVPTVLCGNAAVDAPRHFRCVWRRRRRASVTAFPRRAWERVRRAASLDSLTKSMSHSKMVHRNIADGVEIALRYNGCNIGPISEPTSMTGRRANRRVTILADSVLESNASSYLP